MTNSKPKNSGVPRPYKSSTLPSPRNVLSEICAPFKIWEVIALLFGFSIIGLFAIDFYTDFTYSNTLVGIGGVFATISIGIGNWTKRNSEQYTPSIENVSKAKNYMLAASRLSLFTISGVMFTIAVLLISHSFDTFFFIHDSTRFTVLLIVGVALLSSYSIIRKLCDYSTDSHKSLPFDVSNIPEVVTIISFILAPALVLFAGLVYDSAPIFEPPFAVTVIDSVALCTAMLLLYISAIARFE